jgi:hypothetical protein
LVGNLERPYWGRTSFEDIFLARPFDFLNTRSIFLKPRLYPIAVQRRSGRIPVEPPRVGPENSGILVPIVSQTSCQI